MAPIVEYIYLYYKKYSNLSLSPLFLKYLRKKRKLAESRKKYHEKNRIFAQETIKNIKEIVLKQAHDPRPYVLSGTFESGKENNFTPKQIDFLQRFYNRHTQAVDSALKFYNISSQDWNLKIKPEVDILQRYFWQEIYGKEHKENLPITNKRIVDKEILGFTNSVLRAVHIDPTSILLKTSSKTTKALGETITFAEFDLISLSSILQEYYLGTSDIINIYFPVISLALSDFMSYLNFIVGNSGKTFIHETGHAYLLHGIEESVFKHNLDLKKLHEIEADCILPILNKTCIEIVLKDKLKDIINRFDNYKIKFSKNEHKVRDRLTYLYSADRPSLYEQLIQVLDIGQELWNISYIDIIKSIFAADKSNKEFILKYDKILDENKAMKQYVHEIVDEDKLIEEYNDNIFKIDTKSPNYIGAVDPYFEFKVPRLGENLYKFIKE
jgi:hypothetical protein